MPATTSGSVKPKNGDDQKFRFVKCDLTNQQRDALRYWREQDADPQALLEWVDKRVADGHTIGLKSQEDGYMATLTGVRAASGHVQMCLTARSTKPTNALFALWYKDEEVLKGAWVAVSRFEEMDL